MSQTLNSPATYSSAEVVRLTGATWRQINHWCDSGYLPTSTHGSGYPRWFTADELDTVRLVVVFTRFGLTLGRAFEMARALVAEDRYSVVLGDVFELAITVRNVE